MTFCQLVFSTVSFLSFTFLCLEIKFVIAFIPFKKINQLIMKNTNLVGYKSEPGLQT